MGRTLSGLTTHMTHSIWTDPVNLCQQVKLSCWHWISKRPQHDIVPLFYSTVETKHKTFLEHIEPLPHDCVKNLALEGNLPFEIKLLFRKLRFKIGSLKNSKGRENWTLPFFYSTDETKHKTYLEHTEPLSHDCVKNLALESNLPLRQNFFENWDL